MNEFILDLQNIDSQDKAFLLFRHVILGASFDYQNNFYIKHNSLVEATYVSEQSKIIELESRKKGLISEKEKLIILDENGSWTADQEEVYQEQLKKIQDLQISKKKLIIPAQIKAAEKILDKEAVLFSTLFLERSDAVGLTVENYTQERNSEYFIKNFFFKDEDLTQPLFSKEEFEDLDRQKMQDFLNYYYDFQEVFSERNLKKICCAPIVLNVFFLSESSSDFYGIPICKLTMNQINAYSNYLYYKNVSSAPDFKQVPTEYYKDLNRVVDYYDQQYSIISSKNNSKKR